MNTYEGIKDYRFPVAICKKSKFLLKRNELSECDYDSFAWVIFLNYCKLEILNNPAKPYSFSLRKIYLTCHI